MAYIRSFLLRFFFFLSFLSIYFSCYFMHMRGLLYASYTLQFLLLLLNFRTFLQLLNRERKFFILSIFFLLSLFLSVLYSPFISSSLDSFLINYFFNFIIVFYFMVFCFKNDFPYFLFFIMALLSIFVDIIWLIFVFFKCNFSLSCFLLGGVGGNLLPFLHNIAYLTPVHVFSGLIFIGFALKEETFRKYVYIFASFLSFFIILWLARRAAILGIIFGFCLSVFLFPKFLRYSLIVFVVLSSAIIFICFSPYGKRVLIRSDQWLLKNWNADIFHRKTPPPGSLALRLYAWSKYLNWALKHPFIGTGLGRRVQKRVLADIKRETRIQHSHNLFLQLWLQAGVHSMILFLLLYIYTIKKLINILFKFREKDNSNLFILWSTFVFLFAYMLMSFFDAFDKRPMFIPFWIAVAMVWSSDFWLASGLIWDRASRESSALPG